MAFPKAFSFPRFPRLRSPNFCTNVNKLLHSVRSGPRVSVEKKIRDSSLLIFTSTRCVVIKRDHSWDECMIQFVAVIVSFTSSNASGLDPLLM